MMADTRRCENCKDHPGEYVRDAFAFEGRSYPEMRRACSTCHGQPDMPRPDFDAIRAQIMGRKGLRSKRPEAVESYYVWRMARFHGGADMTIPIMAMTDMHGNPWIRELDAFADLIAKETFGSNLAAARRWGRALGYVA